MNARYLTTVLLSTLPVAAVAQSVCLPAPRLLTTFPMGGRAGTTFDVTISGQHIEDAETLSFSHPGITATSKLNADGIPIPNQYSVNIAADCPPGIHEARVMTRLGVSSSRAFTVGNLAEVASSKPGQSVETATEVPINSVCNAVMTKQSIDYFRFAATAGQRLLVDCLAQGIDSKLKPVVIVADASGADLVVERRGRPLHFEVPADGTYVIKVHDLTYNGGQYFFYRLAVREQPETGALPMLPATRSVSSFSWPPSGLSPRAVMAEAEPNNAPDSVQKVELPCDISGSFFPAADVDTFEFTAKKDEVWWVEVASERLGRPTDPSVVVQHVSADGALKDIAELSDIASPVKVSSNGYSYDGPPYNAGSTDVLGSFTVPEDGTYRLSIRDLFGGTRSDNRNVYRLVVRKAQADFALVAWALHMNLRNGDRNALSKPIALRGGATMPLEVVVIRRDGFDGEIDLFMDNLPPGVTAAGLKIPKGQSRGIMLVSASEDAPRGLSSARFYGRGEIGGEVVERRCHLASMAWPVPNAWSEIPAPRLLADVPVSVCGSEKAPLTIAAAEEKVWEVTAGEKLSIPLKHLRRCEFSGANISLKTFGQGFDRNPAFDATLTGDASQAELDLARLKPVPGDYTIAFYGSAVAKYSHNPGAVAIAEAGRHQAEEQVNRLAAEVKSLQESAATASEQEKPTAQQAVTQAQARHKAAVQALKAAEKRLASAKNQAKPKDIVDIVVSEPIRIRVKAAEKP